MKIKRGTYFCIAGAIMLFSSLCLLVYNMNEDNQAETRTLSILEELKAQMPEPHEEKDDEITDIFVDNSYGNEIPEIDIFAEYENKKKHEADGEEFSHSNEVYYYVEEYSYMGVLCLPSLGLELPVMSDWSYPNLRVSPCRYSGTVEGGDLIIAAHNYNCHFGRISELVPGSEIIFIDGAGVEHRYVVTGSETIGGQNSAAMASNSGDWDLTLFTCTYSGASRVTIRAEFAEE